jgi:hypothetical protein
VKVNRIIDAVRSVVPPSMWGDIRRKLGTEDEAAERLEEEDIFEPDDDPFDVR